MTLLTLLHCDLSFLGDDRARLDAALSDVCSLHKQPSRLFAFVRLVALAGAGGGAPSSTGLLHPRGQGVSQRPDSVTPGYPLTTSCPE